MQQVVVTMPDSAEVHYLLGLCYLKMNKFDLGEQYMNQALQLNERIAYGEPFIHLAEALKTSDPTKALNYLTKFHEVNSSSCKAFYRSGQLYSKLGEEEQARQSMEETLNIYRNLPKYKRKVERKWALYALIQRKRV